MLVSCEHIEDTNGNDTSLVTISLEKLSGTSISSTSSGVSTSTTRKIKTTMSQHEDIDNDTLIMKGGTTSGVTGIMATSLTKGDPLQIDCSSKIDSGNLGLVIISPSNEIIYEFATNTSDMHSFTAKEDGIYIVRLGAESFSGRIELSKMFVKNKIMID